MVGRIVYDFSKGNVAAEVAQLPDKIYVATLEVLRERVELMVGLAKVYVRVDTGSLRDSIRMQWIGEGRRVCTVRAGGYVTNPKTGRTVDYAVYVENRYPFLRPAWAAVAGDIERLIEDHVILACKQQ